MKTEHRYNSLESFNFQTLKKLYLNKQMSSVRDGEDWKDGRPEKPGYYVTNSNKCLNCRILFQVDDII